MIDLVMTKSISFDLNQLDLVKSVPENLRKFEKTLVKDFVYMLSDWPWQDNTTGRYVLFDLSSSPTEDF